MSEPRNASSIDLVELLEMTHEEYVNRFRGTAIRRAKHWMLQRNAAVALGNIGNMEAAPHLDRAMRENPHPIVRGHAAWAIGEIGKRHDSRSAVELLQRALRQEQDATVVDEIEVTLSELRQEA